jgi:predicted RNase H-like nuclease
MARQQRSPSRADTHTAAFWVAGVDGCRAGWIVMLARAQNHVLCDLQYRLCARFREVLQLHPTPAVIAVDMPIGLLARYRAGGRRCDQLARRLLGRRASCIFSPPSRTVLHATDYEQVRTHGLSRQAYGILPKIRQVDRIMSPALQHTVYEAHPELAFMSLSGRPIMANKKTPAGREARLQALGRAVPSLHRLRHALTHAASMFKRAQVAGDDMIDASVLTWTAFRIATGNAHRVPARPGTDRRGLRMEIWF